MNYLYKLVSCVYKEPVFKNALLTEVYLIVIQSDRAG